jgi:hypothetical protein
MAAGQLEHELELHVPASEAWELFGTLGIGKMVVEEIPQIFQKVELIEGDGGVGTILKLTFAQGRSLFFFLVISLPQQNLVFVSSCDLLCHEKFELVLDNFYRCSKLKLINVSKKKTKINPDSCVRKKFW